MVQLSLNIVHIFKNISSYSSTLSSQYVKDILVCLWDWLICAVFYLKISWQFSSINKPDLSVDNNSWILESDYLHVGNLPTFHYSSHPK